MVRNVKNMSSTIALAEKLPEYEKPDFTHGKPPKAGKAKGGGVCYKQRDDKGREQKGPLQKKMITCYV